MHYALYATVLLALMVSSHAARAEDCSKRQTQPEQIACLQQAVDSLRLELEAVTTRLALSAQLDSTVRSREEASIDRMIEDKIRKAMEPRLQLLPDAR